MKNLINNNLDIVKKIAFIYARNLFKTIFIGSIFYIIFIILGIVFLVQKHNYSIDGGVISNLTDTISNHILSVVIFITLIIASPILTYSTANQYAVNKTITFLINDKTNIFLEKVFDTIFNLYKSVQPEIVKNAADFSREKINLINNINSQYRNNRIIRKITKTIIQKLQLEELGLADDNISFYETLKQTYQAKILEYAEPSLNTLYKLIAVQIISLIFIYFFQGIN